MRFRTSFLITLAFHLTILAVDKGAGFVILWILQDMPDKKGGLALLTNLPPILMAISNLGLASSLVYFMRRGEVNAKTAGRTTSMVALVWGFFVALLAFVVIRVWSALDPTADLPSWGILIPVLATPPFLLLISYRNSIQLVLQKIFGYNLVHLIPSVAYLPIFLLVYYGLTGGDAYLAGVYGRFLPAVVVALGLAWVLRAHVPLVPGLDFRFFKKALSYGWRANLGSTLSYLNHRLDIYLVRVLFYVSLATEAEAEVGFYSLAVTLAELIWHFPEAMRDLLFSKVAGLSQEEARLFTPTVCRNSFWICLVGGVVIWFVHDPLLGLIYRSWQDTWAPTVTPALGWLLPGTIFFTIAKVLRADIMARGRVNAGICFAALVFVTMMIGDFLLVPEGGAVGAAIASTVAYAIGALGTMIYYAYMTRVRFSDLLLIRREDLVHYREVFDRLRRRPKQEDDRRSDQ